MRTRTHCILILTALLVLGTTDLRAQQAPPQDNTIVTRIYELTYFPAGQLLNILDTVIDGPSVRFAVDNRSNQLLVTAPPEQFERITAIIRELDVPTGRDAERLQMLYRVYMLEPPVKGQNMQVFSLTLIGPKPLHLDEFIAALEQAALQVSSVTQEAGSEMSELRIEGRAPLKEGHRKFRNTLQRRPHPGIALGG